MEDSSALDFGVNTSEITSVITTEDTLEDGNFFGDLNNLSQEEEQVDILTDENMMINPFFVNLNGGELMKKDNREIYSEYNRVVVMSLSNMYNMNHVHILTQKYINKHEFQECCQSFTLHNAPMRMLKLHRKMATIVDRPFLKQFNRGNLDLNNDEIVVCLFELNESDARLYINSLYTEKYNFKDMLKVLILFKRFGGDKYGKSLQSNISRIITNLRESKYWGMDYNCKMKMSKAFLDRRFKYHDGTDATAKSVGRTGGFQNKDATEIIKKIIDNPMDSDYLQGLLNNVIYQKEVYIDGATASRGTRCFYKIQEQNDFTQEQITELFKIVDNDRMLYDLFNAFLLSKTHCHLVINNKDVLEIMTPIINKFMPLYKNLFGYAWICMYMEECIKKTRTTDEDRYIFSIDTASKLPVFPYASDDIHTNPYNTFLASSKAINSKRNYVGLGMIKNYNDYGISSYNDFIRKMNIFMTGSADKSIFDGLDADENGKWKDFVVSGSIMTACIPNRSPLIDTITTPDDTFEQKFNRFFSEYYNDSDIDIICTKESIFDFMDEVMKLKNVIVNNLNNIVGKDVSETIKITPCKSLRIAFNKAYIEHCMPDYDLDYVIDNLSSPVMRNAFFFKYTNIKQQACITNAKRSMANSLYNEYFKPTDWDDMILLLTPYDIPKSKVTEFDTDHYIYLNDVLPDEKQVPDEENILIFKLSENIKFKIESPHLKHNLEVFKSKFSEPFSIVSRFHLPCVRGYFQGNDVKLLPSCITAHMTGLNIEYKYIAGKWDPIHIVNKYIQRGYGVILNPREIAHMVEYNKESSEWKHIFNINSNAKINKHLGYRKINDDIFKPGKFKQGLPDDVYRSIDYQYIETIEDLYDVYKTKYGYDPKQTGFDLLKFKTISEDGTILPFKRWILDASWDTMN